MKKLGKKNYEIIETIEAYNHCADCSGIRSCVDYCNSTSYHDINTDEYNDEYDSQNQ